MKALILFFVLAFVSCVTAKPRDLSTINPQLEPTNQSSAVSDSLFKFSGVKNEKPLQVADYPQCMDVCVRDNCCNPAHGDECPLHDDASDCVFQCHNVCYRE